MTARMTALPADPDPLMRAVVATGALHGMPPGERLILLQPEKTDPIASDRVAEAQALHDARPQPATAEDRALPIAFRIWQTSLAAHTDFPETHVQIDGAVLTMRNRDVT